MPQILSTFTEFITFPDTHPLAYTKVVSDFTLANVIKPPDYKNKTHALALIFPKCSIAPDVPEHSLLEILTVTLRCFSTPTLTITLSSLLTCILNS